MDSQLAVAPENLPSSSGFEPLPFLRAKGLTSLKRGFLRNRLLNGYGTFAVLLYLLAITQIHGWRLEVKY